MPTGTHNRLTKPQQRALKQLWDRDPKAVSFCSYIAFRRRVVVLAYLNCAIVHWCGMTVGIEMDGYTHT